MVKVVKFARLLSVCKYETVRNTLSKKY